MDLAGDADSFLFADLLLIGGELAKLLPGLFQRTQDLFLAFDACLQGGGDVDQALEVRANRAKCRDDAATGPSSRNRRCNDLLVASFCHQVDLVYVSGEAESIVPNLKFKF